MLFTPPPPLSSEPISSSVKNASPSSLPSSPPPSSPLPPPSTLYTPSESDVECIEAQPRTSSSSYNATLITNGPPNNRFLSTSQSRFSQLPDQDWFYSPSASSSSRPSVHLTPTSTKISDTESASAHRRVSCPVPRNNTRKEHRFRFPSIITSSIRDALMTNTSATNPNKYTNDIVHLPRTSLPGCKRPSNIFLPVANPVAAAALIEDDESETIDEQPKKSITPSPVDTPKSNARFHRTSTECSTNIDPSHNYTRKAILNVGGVRHEGNF